MFQQMSNMLSSGVRAVQRNLRHGLRLHESEQAIIRQAQQFWNSVSNVDQEEGRAHWRGHGVFANDDARWNALGANNLRLFEKMAGKEWLKQRRANVVDWGSGGGCNAVHFGVGAANYFAVDITADSLSECGKQMLEAGLNSFKPIHIQISRPEQALELIDAPCDLILSTYVFEVIPTKQYGERLLDIMSRLLRPDGLAFLQVKYSDLSWSSKPRPWNYKRNMADMTTYRIEEFWNTAPRHKLEPEQVILEPQQPLVDDRRYAYYLLRKAA